MARKGKDSKRENEALRRFQQGSGRQAASAREARERMAQELADPQRFKHYLSVFSQLALLLPELRVARFSPNGVVEELLELELPEALEGFARVGALRKAVIPNHASLELAKACSAAIQAAIDTQDDREALLGLTAGGAFCTNCIEEGGSPEHPFWEVVFEVTLTEVLLSGLLLIRLALSRLDEKTEVVGAAFARALAGERGSELVALGVDANAAELASAFAAALYDPQPYNLEFDAVLHLVHMHGNVCGPVGRHLSQQGWSEEVATVLLSSYAQAYANDADESLVRELRRWCRTRLETLRDDPQSIEASLGRPLEEERLRCAATWLSLRELSVEDNALLRTIHVRSLALSRTAASELELPFLSKLWGQTSDGFALNAYERFLTESNNPVRARRVARFRAWLAEQAEADAAESEAASASEEAQS